jgi:hypothetical protein
MPQQPVTSAALGKVGQSPLGLLVGSHVKGSWSDRDHQVPVIEGSMGKAGEYKGSTNIDGIPEIDIDKGSMPTAATNKSPPTALNPFSKLHEGRITINDINNGVKTVKDITRSTGVVSNKAVDSKLKEATLPTLASVAKGNTGDILSLIKKADPSNFSATLPGMVANFSDVKNILNLTSATGLTNLLSNGLQGAIGALGAQLGFNNALKTMTSLLDSNVLPAQAQAALKSAVLAGIVAGDLKSMPQVISKHVPVADPKIKPLANLLIQASNLPPTYVQMYYPAASEPYPGYIEWADTNDKNKKFYTLRGNEPHYESPEEHLAGNAAFALQKAMSSTVSSAVKGLAAGALPSLSTAQLSTMASSITGALGNISAEGISKILGNGVNMSNMTKLASSLVPGIAGKIDGIMKGQLPKSVLDPGKVAKTMNEFTKNQALLAKKKESMKKALEPNTAGEDKLLDKFKGGGLEGLDAEDKKAVMNGELTKAEKAQYGVQSAAELKAMFR